MFFARRSGGATRRFLAARVGLFFLAAGLWFAGAAVENFAITAVAMGIAVLAVAVGLFARREDREAEERDA